MQATVHYLYNSGFALETEKHLFIFDYYLDDPPSGGLRHGVINPREIAALGKETVVLVSHGHFDHFNRVIFGWRGAIPGVRYVLSSDIPHRPGIAAAIAPGEERDFGDFTLRALHSTDLGVAFLIKTEGLTLYHGGDLNWWHWEGEPEEDNREMALLYKKEIDSLAGEHIDLAFLPLDPRLEQPAYLLGMDYFLRHVEVERVLPMHFGDDGRVFDWLERDPRAAEYRDRVVRIERRGQSFSLEL